MTYQKISKFLFICILGIPLFIACNSKNKHTVNKKEGSDKHPSLKSIFQGKFYMGAAISKEQIAGVNTSEILLLEEQFNSISPENDLKWERIHPDEDSFYFDIADKYVALGEKNDMNIVGHALIWHSQLAPWMHNIKDSLTMAHHVENHINTIVGRYKGKIDTWDVVNEALNEDGSLRASPFLEVMGDQYINYAFQLASIADPDAELVYNDYNLWKPEKREGVIRLVKQLQSKGIKIDGVGMQAHWSLLGPSVEDIENSIIAYAELGVKVMITELDVTVLPNPWDIDGAAVEQNYDQYEGDPRMNPYPEQLSDSAKVQLSKRYEDIFKLFLKHQDKISRVTFWGINDGNSWLNNWPIKGRTNYPLLFDRESQFKEAYYSVLASTDSN